MSNKYLYYIEDDELIIMDKKNKIVTWAGKPLGINVTMIQQLPNLDTCIVLLDWKIAADNLLKNLLCINSDGSIRWKVKLPPSNLNYSGVSRSYEVYTHIVSGSEESIAAYSFSGFIDEIDLESGEVISSKFVK